jgi:hypothetical protein
VAKNAEDKSMDRRGFLECMAWVGTGAVWTMSSGVLKGVPLGQTGNMPMAHARGSRDLLGLTQVSFHGVNHPIAGTDAPLEGPPMASAGDHAVSAPLIVG